ncbi:Lysosome membrane protein 2 [Eumeta japonica]|uniref:Lysosome membrane protein 2 n=1 Tax=Eumeta variegata TaxID=151549 RepID=A0A4C1X044_EUMVA|nr:Lysosome membrane protein 2 [Eumeta japonica]
MARRSTRTQIPDKTAKALFRQSCARMGRVRPMSLFYSDTGRWNGREIARFVLSLARSVQAERDNESWFFNLSTDRSVVTAISPNKQTDSRSILTYIQSYRCSGVATLGVTQNVLESDLIGASQANTTDDFQKPTKRLSDSRTGGSVTLNSTRVCVFPKTNASRPFGVSIFYTRLALDRFLSLTVPSQGDGSTPETREELRGPVGGDDHLLSNGSFLQIEIATGGDVGVEDGELSAIKNNTRIVIKSLLCPRGRGHGRKASLFLMLMLGFFALGAGCFILIAHPYDILFKLKVVLADGGEIFEMWRKPEVDLYTRVFLFNVTNADAYMAGDEDTLKFQEVGPYVCKEILEHTDVVFNPNKTLSAVPKHPLQWVDELSEGHKEDDLLYLPHIALLKPNEDCDCNLKHDRDRNQESYPPELGARRSFETKGGGTHTISTPARPRAGS